MQEKKKSGPVCCGQNLRKLRFYRGVSYVALCLGIGGGLGWLGLENMAQAAICFLPDCGDKILEFQGDANLSTKYCRDAGYTYYELGQCPPYYHQEVCPENSHYLKCDAQKWCEDNGYNTLPEECVVPQYADEQCLNGLNYYKQCKEDLARACSEENPDYVSECQEGWKLDDDELCSYSPLYGKCCNECEDYPYEEDEIPQGYQKGESCLACGDITKYKSKLKDCAGDGFIQCANGGKTGTEVCWRGDEKWYKECCAPCDDYPYLENQIPEGYVKGDSCDSCDGMKYKTKVGECATDYKWENGACVSACDKTCSVGNILYSDMTCNSCLVSGKTPIGIVSYTEGTKRLAINLPISNMAWSSKRIDIAGIHNYASGHNEDMNGKHNTLAWIAIWGKNIDNYAPGFCYNFTTENTSKGQWYLPSAGETGNIKKNARAINDGLSKIGENALPSSYWTSTEGDYIFYAITRDTYFYEDDVKEDKNYAKCVLSFEEQKEGIANVCSVDYIYSCVGEGYYGGTGDSCGGLYKECTCSPGFEWRGSGCCDNICSVGSVVYSDLSCCSNEKGGQFPIGVISYQNEKNLRAIQTANPLASSWAPSTANVWVTYQSQDDVKLDMDGKLNTKAWINYWGEEQRDYPAGNCYTYNTLGTSMGDWYLPSAGELYTALCENKDDVNRGLTRAQVIVPSGTSYGSTSINYWSSSNYDSRYAWYVNSRQCSIYTYDITTYNQGVRCMLLLEAKDNGMVKICGEDYLYTCVPDDSSHISGGIGESCGGVFKSCSCTDGYVWRNGQCALCDNTKSCCVGDILNSDLTCSSERIEGKTPIGVVSYISDDKRLAIQLDAPGEMKFKPFSTYSYPFYSKKESALNDYDGKENTDVLHSMNVNYGAPSYCYNYNTEGTSVGDWYLPSLGELYTSIYLNRRAVDGGLHLTGAKLLPGFNPIWSSTSRGASDGWYAVVDGDVYATQCTNTCEVRCVLAF